MRHLSLFLKQYLKNMGFIYSCIQDNGSPFASVRSLGRITKVAVWLMELGIEPVYLHPGRPDQNGRHERMHRELKSRKPVLLPEKTCNSSR